MWGQLAFLDGDIPFMYRHSYSDVSGPFRQIMLVSKQLCDVK